MEGRVLAAGDGRRSAAGTGDTDAKDICGKTTGNIGGVGGQQDYFICVCARDRVRRRGDTPGAMVEVEGSRVPVEGHGGSNFGSGKVVAATGIRQA